MRTKQFFLRCAFSALIVTALLPSVSDQARADLCECIGGGMMRCSLLGHTSVEPATDAFPQCKLQSRGGGERKQPNRKQPERTKRQVFSCPRGFKSVEESSYGTHRCVPIDVPSAGDLTESNDEALARKNWFSRTDRPTRTPDEQHRGSSPIGSVGALRGEASWVWPDGKTTPVRRGEPAFLGNKIITAATGRVQLLLLDNTVFTVGPKSDMKIDEFVFDPNEDRKNLTVKFEKGVFRFVTGKLPHNDPANMKVNMPVGGTGIRGSEVQFALDQDGGNIEVYSGEATFTNTIGETFVLKAAQTIAFDPLGRYVNLPVLPPYSKQLWEWCYGNDATPEMQFAGCDNIIRSEKLSGKDLAVTFGRRAGAYQRKNDYERAIVDWTEAIRIDPSYTQLYLGRGRSYYVKGDYDRVIADSSEAIKLNPSHDAFVLRGLAWHHKDNSDRAIADLNEAIRLDPKDRSAYNSRGLAFETKGDLDRAIADYSEAIRLDPKDADGYSSRGRAQLYSGALSKALVDLTRASEMNPKDIYAALWLDIVNKRSNLPSRLAEATRQVDMTKWPAPVMRLYLGQFTPEATLAAADDPDPDAKKGQVCEANFYNGELALQRGAKDEATRLFRLAAADCPKGFVESEGAVAELRTLGVSP